MPTPIRLDGLLAKVESVYATDSVPVVGSDAIRVSERIWNQLQIGFAFRNRRDDAVSGSLIPPPPGVPKGRIVTLDFGWEMKGSRSGGAYSAGNKTEAAPLIVSCQTAETLITTGGSESLTYQHADTNHSSCTIYAYAGGYQYKIVGCRGIVRWPINVGTLGVLRFQMQGLLLADPTVASLPGGFTYATPAPFAGVGMGLSVGGIWTPDVISGEFNQGATLQRLDSGNAADGVQSFDVGDTVQPMFTISAKSVTSGYDPYADFKAQTARSLALTYNSIQYNRAKLNVTNMYVDSLRHENQNGFTGWTIAYLVDNSWALKFD